MGSKSSLKMWRYLSAGEGMWLCLCFKLYWSPALMFKYVKTDYCSLKYEHASFSCETADFVEAYICTLRAMLRSRAYYYCSRSVFTVQEGYSSVTPLVAINS